MQDYLKKLRPTARPDPVVKFKMEPGHRMQRVEFRKPGHKLGMLAAFVANLGYSRVSYAEFVTDNSLVNAQHMATSDLVAFALAFALLHEFHACRLLR